MAGRQRTRSGANKSAPRFTKLNALSGEAQKEYGLPMVTNAAAMPGKRCIETDIFMMDMATLGGLPEGEATMIYGWEHSGKTTTAMRVAAAAQRKYPDKAAVFVDVERSFDPNWATQQGVDVERLFMIDPENGEQAVNLIEAALRTGEVSSLIVDSLPAMMPVKDLERAAEDKGVAERARLIAVMCGKIQAAWQEQRTTGQSTTVLFINQFRTKIGVTYGDPRTLPGGSAPQYMVACKMELKNKEITGPDARKMNIVLKNEHSFKIPKGKFGNSMRAGEYEMIRDPGHPKGAGAIDETKQIVTYAKRNELITGGGTKWKLAGVERTFRKQDEMIDWLGQQPEYEHQTKQLVIMAHRSNMGLRPIPHDNHLLGQVDAETTKIFNSWFAE